jgi:hypothetical protein
LFSKICIWALMQLPAFAWMPTIGHPRRIDAASHDVVLSDKTAWAVKVTVVTERK